MALLAPVQTTAPVAGTTAGVWRFASPVEALTVDAPALGADAYIRLDGSAATAANGGYQVRAPDGEGVVITPADLGMTGLFQTVSVWIPAGGTVGNLRLSGYQRGE